MRSAETTQIPGLTTRAGGCGKPRRIKSDLNQYQVPESTLSRWSHHQAGTAFKQAHVPIREALDTYTGLSQFKYEIFLQGSYKNDTNLGGDSDVDVVVRLAQKLKPGVAALSGEQLQEDGSYRFALERWQSFRDQALKAMRARFEHETPTRNWQLVSLVC